jgi:hypothetical protein
MIILLCCCISGNCIRVATGASSTIAESTAGASAVLVYRTWAAITLKNTKATNNSYLFHFFF